MGPAASSSASGCGGGTCAGSLSMGEVDCEGREDGTDNFWPQSGQHSKGSGVGAGGTEVATRAGVVMTGEVGIFSAELER